MRLSPQTLNIAEEAITFTGRAITATADLIEKERSVHAGLSSRARQEKLDKARMRLMEANRYLEEAYS